MRPIVDGHNDALRGEDHALIAHGRPDGDLDLPRMRQGGVRGAIFAVFTPSEDDHDGLVPRVDGVKEFAYAPPVSQERAAAHATAAAGRLLALERAGHLTVARTTADLDGAHG